LRHRIASGERGSGGQHFRRALEVRSPSMKVKVPGATEAARTSRNEMTLYAE
jgi:hypothetical protein